METHSYLQNPLANLSSSAPFPFSVKREEEDRLIFGDRRNFREIKPNFCEKKSGFRFEHMATEFEHNMEENDSGIGRQIYLYRVKPLIGKGQPIGVELLVE